ncbi:MAG: type II secretion system F family protein [Candidatus Omnitrophota bacterium]
MIKYQYKARDKFAKLTSGFMEAASEGAVADKLKEADFIPVSIEVAGKESGFDKIFTKLFRKVRPTELNMFTRQFAVMQKAGVSVIASLNAMSNQSTNKVFKETLDHIAIDINSGKSLSAAFENHPKLFDSLYTNMVKVGEESGTLVEALERLADLREYDAKVNSRIKGATRYPIIVVVAISIAFLILTLLIVPRFAKVYMSAGVNLPLPTLILIWTNKAVTKFWWALIIIIAALIYGFRRLTATKKGRLWWDSLRLKFPVFGSLMIKIEMGRFAKVTGTMMRAGVPILRIMDLSAQGVNNTVISRAIASIGVGVSEGKGMAESMKTSGMFTPVVTQMVSVGEDTGKVDELLLHVADYYDAEAGFMIDNLTSLIEPMLLLVLGCGVLLMALGIFLPMWNLMQLFQK